MAFDKPVPIVGFFSNQKCGYLTNRYISKLYPMRTLTLTFVVAIFLAIFSELSAQSQKADLIRIMISPSKPGMIYQPNEKIEFDVAVYKFGQLLENAEITYSVGPEMMDAEDQGTVVLR